MCGIAGIVTPQARRFENCVEDMVAVQRHRGPDSAGVLSFEGCTLGHARLSIIDIDGGQQPMMGPRPSVAVVFNGEIYGYQALRRQMPAYPFQTQCDTEMLLALYETYGTDMLEHLPGMFAFAIWDEEKQLLFAARDRFGEKPLYYAQPDADCFLFASEVKGILAGGRVEKRINAAALAHYLQRLYIPEGSSAYLDIVALPPAHALELHKGTLKVYPYWSPPIPSSDSITLTDAAGQLKDLLRGAVRKQLVADVEVSAFLSGGLDSTSIVSLAAAAGPLRTLSFGFDMERKNELPFAKAAAQKYQTRHQECTLRTEDLPGLMLKMARIYDEPFGDSSCIPTYLICQEAAKNVRVVLTGDGGDELLGGYGWYRPQCYMEDFAAGPLGRLTAGLLSSAIHMKLLRGGKYRRRAARSYFRYGDSLLSHWHSHQYYTPREIAAMGLAPADCPARPHAYRNAVDMAMRCDITDYMPGDILRKVDRASMACSLELRAPFLDVDVAAFLISLPTALKVSTDDDKILLRHAFSQDWPESIRRRRKVGFGAPVRLWLTYPGMDELIHEYTLRKGCLLHDWIPPRACRHYMQRNDYRSWLLLCLGIWLATV